MSETPTNQQKTGQKLTKKQRGFVHDYVLTENGTQSVLKHYNTTDYKTASVIAAENLDKPSIQDAIESKRFSLREALEKEGVTPIKVAQKVNELLDATDGKRPDYSAIDKGLKHATNIYGVDTEPTKPTGNVYNILFASPEIKADVQALEAAIKARFLQKHEPQTH